MQSESKQQWSRVFGKAAVPGLVVIAAFAAPEVALAGEAGEDEFSEVWDTLVEWSQGTLGRIIALAFILVGLIRGIAAQSIMSFAIGVGAGLGLYNAETIVNALFGAGIPALEAGRGALEVGGSGVGIPLGL